jgi:uncharacterized membrane protein
LKNLVLVFFSLIFAGIGIAHFLRTDSFLLIMPPYLPLHRELVYVSGAFEILGGVGLLIPRLRRTAACGLIALLFAVFPANVHMALNPDKFKEIGIPTWALYARLPVQFLLMYAIWWAITPKRNSSVLNMGQSPVDEGAQGKSPTA